MDKGKQLKKYLSEFSLLIEEIKTLTLEKMISEEHEEKERVVILEKQIDSVYNDSVLYQLEINKLLGLNNEPK